MPGKCKRPAARFDRAERHRDRARSPRLTFSLSLDLLLAARGDVLRAADVPGLADALGRCSTARDLRHDLAAGLLNIPADVMQDAGDAAAAPFAIEPLLQAEPVRRWLNSERAHALRALDAVDVKLATLADRPGSAVLKLFARSVRGFAGARFERLYAAPAGMTRTP